MNLVDLTIRLLPCLCLCRVVWGSGRAVLVVVNSKQSFLFESEGYFGGAGSSVSVGLVFVTDAYVFR